MDREWDFNCPQFVDFNHIDELDQDDTDAFFENCKINSIEDNESQEVPKKRLQSYECSVEYRSTNVVSTQTSSLSASSTGDVNGSKTGLAAAKSTTEGRKTLTARRSSERHYQLSNAKKVLGRKEQKTIPTKSSKAAEKGQKRNISFADSGCSKKTRPSLTTAIRWKCKTKKQTFATTPRCLQRSKNKKILKSSEEIELEKIAEMRKQVNKQMKTNRMAMRKIIHPPALQPLPQETVREDGAATADQSKKAPVELKKGVPMVFGNKFPSVPFSFRAPKLPQDGAGTSLVNTPGLQRCSTPYSTKRRSISRVVGRKTPAAGLHSVKATEVPMKSKKLPEASSKAVSIDVQKKPNQSSSSQIKVPKKDARKVCKNSKSTASGKATENMPPTNNEDDASSANSAAGKVPFEDVANKLPSKGASSIKPLSKNQGSTLSSKSASKLSSQHQVSGVLQEPRSRRAHSLVKRAQAHSGLPFLRKLDSDSMILPADSATLGKSILENATPATPRRSARINKDVELQEQAKQVKGGTGNESKDTNAMSSASNADNSIQCKAEKKAKDWRRKIEGELELQKKSIIKSSKPGLLRSASTSSKSLVSTTR